MVRKGTLVVCLLLLLCMGVASAGTSGVKYKSIERVAIGQTPVDGKNFSVELLRFQTPDSIVDAYALSADGGFVSDVEYAVNPLGSDETSAQLRWLLYTATRPLDWLREKADAPGLSEEQVRFVTQLRVWQLTGEKRAITLESADMERLMAFYAQNKEERQYAMMPNPQLYIFDKSATGAPEASNRLGPFVVQAAGALGKNQTVSLQFGADSANCAFLVDNKRVQEVTLGQLFMIQLDPAAVARHAVSFQATLPCNQIEAQKLSFPGKLGAVLLTETDIRYAATREYTAKWSGETASTEIVFRLHVITASGARIQGAQFELYQGNYPGAEPPKAPLLARLTSDDAGEATRAGLLEAGMTYTLYQSSAGSGSQPAVNQVFTVPETVPNGEYSVTVRNSPSSSAFAVSAKLSAWVYAVNGILIDPVGNAGTPVLHPGDTIVLRMRLDHIASEGQYKPNAFVLDTLDALAFQTDAQWSILQGKPTWIYSGDAMGEKGIGSVYADATLRVQDISQDRLSLRQHVSVPGYTDSFGRTSATPFGVEVPLEIEKKAEGMESRLRMWLYAADDVIVDVEGTRTELPLVSSGSLVSFRLQLSNLGTQPILPQSIRVPKPEGFDFSATDNPVWCDAGDFLEFQAASLISPGKSVLYELRLRVRTGLADATWLLLTAQVEGYRDGQGQALLNRDPSGDSAQCRAVVGSAISANLTGQFWISAVNGAPVSAEAGVDKAPALVAGDYVEFRIRVQNQGTLPVKPEAFLIATSALEWEPATGWEREGDALRIAYTGAPLRAGEAATQDIRLRVPPTLHAGSTIRLEAWLSHVLDANDKPVINRTELEWDTEFRMAPYGDLAKTGNTADALWYGIGGAACITLACCAWLLGGLRKYRMLRK